MIVFKVLLIVALVVPLVYFAAIMMNSVVDEVLKEKKTAAAIKAIKNERNIYNIRRNGCFRQDDTDPPPEAVSGGTGNFTCRHERTGRNAHR